MNTLALLAMTDIGAKAIAAAIAILVAGAAAIGMGLAVSKALEGIARPPEFKTLMIGLVFLETCIIYALLVVIFVIFVL